MKKAQTTIRKAIALFLSAAIITNVSFANGETKNSSELKAKVSYVGATGEEVLFNMNFENAEGKKFTVRITDAAGDILYINNYKEKKYQQTFKAPKSLTSKLTFEIVAEKKVYQQSFSIEQKFTEETVVSNN
jgi:hypothetical protein